MSNLSDFMGAAVGAEVTVTEFASPGNFTFTKDSRDKFYIVQVWGAGGSGYASAPAQQNNPGGGGGGYNERYYLPTEIGNTVAVTVGEGGVSTGPIDGGDSSFGNLVAGGGTGAGPSIPGIGGHPNNVRLVNATVATESSGSPFVGGTGNNVNANFVLSYYDSVYGGGGGGLGRISGGVALPPRLLGGTSVYGGNGGRGGDSDAGISASSGQQPGGGGGGAAGAGFAGRGGDGLVKVIIFR